MNRRIGVVIVTGMAAALAACGAADSGGVAASPASSGPAKAAVVLVEKAGNGQWMSPKFGAPGEWTLTYTYDCAAFGYPGNFIVAVVGSDGMPNPVVNELGKKGGTATTQHTGGQVYLEVNSECAWTVQAKG